MTRTIEQPVNQEVLVCVSSLVSTLASEDAISMGGKSDLSNLAEQAFELSCPIPDYEEAAIQAGWTQCADGRWWREARDTDDENELETFLGSGPYMWADDDVQACNTDGLEEQFREVYEHWAVTQWFGEKLSAKGEKVDFDFQGLVVWARTATGQQICSDYVVQEIYEEMMSA